MNNNRHDMITTIIGSEKYQLLVKTRSRFALKLSALVLAIYYAFMMVVAFKPALLKTPIYDTSVISIGFPIAAVMFVLFWLLTGWYVHRSNTRYDQMGRDVIQEVLK
jgi:cation/acetate symporter